VRENVLMDTFAAGGRTARDLERKGWERIGTMWFPWVYFKRPLDLAAEPGEPA